MKYVTLWGGCEPGFQFDCELGQAIVPCICTYIHIEVLLLFQHLRKREEGGVIAHSIYTLPVEC